MVDVEDSETYKQQKKKWTQGNSEHGKSTMFVTCPFCNEEIEVYIWSYHGGGKKCECGAHLFGFSATKKI